LPWRFDTASALVGAAVALLLAGLAYYFRDALRLDRETAMAPLVRLRHRLEASAEDRYRELVANWARSHVVLASLVSLDDVFVEPRLRAPFPAPQSLSEAMLEPPTSRVLPLHRTLGGHPRLVILGAPGTGRTTLLAYVALACVRTVNDGGGNAEAGTTLGPVETRLPLYAWLPAMDWSGTDGAELDLLSLLHAAVTTVGGSSGMASALRQRMETGQAVVLADGWDELSSRQRELAATWLAALVDTLPGNLWLVGAGTRGYASLAEAGFVPLTLAAWDAGQVERFANQWVEVCAPPDKPSPVTSRKLTAELQEAARAGAPPFELALRASVVASGEASPTTRAALFNRALDLLLWQEQRPWLLGICWAVLGQVALSLQREGRATAGREEIEATIASVLPPPEESPARAAQHVFRALTGARGLLRPVGSDRYALAHPLWQAYLAARQLVSVDPASLVERLDDPRWAEALRFYAGLSDMRPLVAAWMLRPGDLFHSHLHTVGSWIRVAPEDAAWRDGAMAVLARGLLQQRGPPQVRQALAEALAATGVQGVDYFFRQATQHPDAGVRAAAVLGLTLTQTASESDLPALEAALGDDDTGVCEAVVRGLAHLGLDAATRWLARILWDGDDTLRPAAAKALAQCGEDGVAYLHEAVESEDVMVRRAAVLGLAQAEAREVLLEVAREDTQWIVRSGAAAALDELEAREKIQSIAPPPEIEQLGWLISWAATQGEGVGLGHAARRMLWRALDEGEVSVRLAAAQVLAQVGRPEDVEPLRGALADSDPAVASTALEALGEIGRRYDLRIEPVGE
jgi:HEAT repeat protein